MVDNTQMDNILALKIMRYIPTTVNWWNEPDGFNCTVEKAWQWTYESKNDRGVEYNGKRYYSKNKFNWNPSKDMNICYEVEERVKELGLQEQYTQALQVLVGNNLYNLVHATPVQRCRAMISLIKTE